MMLEGADDNVNDRDDDDDDSDHHSNDGNSGDEVECSDNSEDYTNLMSDVDFPVDDDDEDEQDANSENNNSSSRKDESKELFTGSEED